VGDEEIAQLFSKN